MNSIDSYSPFIQQSRSEASSILNPLYSTATSFFNQYRVFNTWVEENKNQYSPIQDIYESPLYQEISRGVPIAELGVERTKEALQRVDRLAERSIPIVEQIGKFANAYTPEVRRRGRVINEDPSISHQPIPRSFRNAEDQPLGVNELNPKIPEPPLQRGDLGKDRVVPTPAKEISSSVYQSPLGVIPNLKAPPSHENLPKIIRPVVQKVVVPPPQQAQPPPSPIEVNESAPSLLDSLLMAQHGKDKFFQDFGAFIPGFGGVFGRAQEGLSLFGPGFGLHK